LLWNEVDGLIRISKGLRNFLFTVSVLFISFNLVSATAAAQDSLHPTAQSLALPDSPQPAQSGNELSQSEKADSLRNSTGNISGSVMDSRGDVLQGAQVTLLGPSASDTHTTVSNSDGQFTFIGLQPGVYRVTVTGSGMSTFTSTQISLQAGQGRTLLPITLMVSGGATSVTVNGNKEELSKEQVHIAVQQRIGKVIPNFYSSYDWNAPPMLAKQKFQLSARSLIDPITFLTVAGIAGVEQNRNTFPAYGSGIEGYGKRYGAALANHATSNLLAKALFPSIFHQDPRYFYRGTGSGPSRAFYAVSCAFVTRGDAGNRMPNYSHILGGFTAAAISNLYYPEADRGASLVLVNGLVDIGADAAANLIREFLLKGITSHVPKGNHP
jgi:Carboxypeptidase regulatory-like domain